MTAVVRRVATSSLVLLLAACGAEAEPSGDDDASDTADAGDDPPKTPDADGTDPDAGSPATPHAGVDRFDTTDLGSPHGPQGCGDTVVFTTTADDTLAVWVAWEDAAHRAHEMDGYDDEVQLPHPAVRVGVEVGSSLSLGMCSTIVNIDEMGHAIDREWDAVAGTVRISVEPDYEAAADDSLDSPLSMASVTLEDVELESDGETRSLDRIEFLDATVGCADGGHICGF